MVVVVEVVVDLGHWQADKKNKLRADLDQSELEAN